MNLPAGIYMIRNRATGYFIIPNDGSAGGGTVDTTTAPGEVPINARISVQRDSNDLYTFKSDSNLSIGVSTSKDDLGDHYLQWQEGDYKWVIRSAGLAQWSIKLPNDPLYAIDDRPPPLQPFVPGAMIPTTDLSPTVSTLTQTESDSQVKVNINISIPLAIGSKPSGNATGGATTKTDVLSQVGTAMPANQQASTSQQDPAADSAIPVDNTAPLPLDANLVLKANGGSPSCARWEFINAS